MTDATRAWLAQALVQALRACAEPACRVWLGPVVPGATLAGGARLPGLPHELDPPQAAFNLALMLRWPAPAGDSSERGPQIGAHEAGMVAALLAAADWRARAARRLARAVPTIADVLTEIASCRAGFARPGVDVDALALRGVVVLLGGEAADAERARALLPVLAEAGPDPLWQQAERAAQWLRAALYALRAGPDLEQRWPPSPPAPWPGRLAQRGSALLRRMAEDATLDPMPFDLWFSYLVDT
jgi:hypothetical protein